MPFPSIVLDLIGKISRFRDLSVIDEVTVNGKKAGNVVGRFHDLSLKSISAKCDYKIDGAVHSLEAVYKDGPNNNTLVIDNVSHDIIEMDLKPDFDLSGLIPKVTLEAELKIVYQDDGAQNEIRLSSKPVGA